VLYGKTGHLLSQVVEWQLCLNPGDCGNSICELGWQMRLEILKRCFVKGPELEFLELHTQTLIQTQTWQTTAKKPYGQL
jgi:hypothetical protein